MDLKKEFDGASEMLNKGVDGGVGLVKGGLGAGLGLAGAAFAAPLAFVLGSFVNSKTDWWHIVLTWLAN